MCALWRWRLSLCALLQMMHNLARLAGDALNGKDAHGVGGTGEPQERRPALKPRAGRGQGEGHAGSVAGRGNNKISFASSDGRDQKAPDRVLHVAAGDVSDAGGVLRGRHNA